MDQWIQQIDWLLEHDWIAVVVAVVVLLAATWLLSRLVTKLLRKLLHSEDITFLPSHSIFINVANVAIWVIGICVILAICFNINVSAVVAALGITGIAISLGFQDTVSNLIGGLQVSLMKILKPGDHIQVGPDSGVVKDVTWRHTRITNVLGQTVIIPNASINKTALIKLPPVNQISLTFVVHPTRTDLNAVAKSIEQACVQAAAPLSKITQEPRAFFTEILDTGFKGKVVFRIAQAKEVGKVSDAALRLIAPLTQPSKKETAR